MNWLDFFQAKIVERGYSYYKDGRVKILQPLPMGYKAIVHGTKDYNVRIYLDIDILYTMDCDCEYANQGLNCKHQAATLFAIQEHPSWLLKQEQSLKKYMQYIHTKSPEKLKELIFRMIVSSPEAERIIIEEMNEGRVN